MTASSTIAETYERDGFAFPITVMSEVDAARHLDELERLEAEIGGRRLGNHGQLNHPHLLFRFAAAIANDDAVLDAVEQILGPDLMIWGSTFFIKEARSASFISWHQDLRYWGLEDPDGMVSAWLALTDVNESNGCMKFVRSSHVGGLRDHIDTFSADNALYRGQEAQVVVDDADVVSVPLRPGELSLHHGHLLHSSAPNPSSNRRVGFTMNFVRPSNRQLVSPTDYAMLVRGEDRFGNFEHVQPPFADLDDAAIATHAKVLEAQTLTTYDGAAQGPS